MTRDPCARFRVRTKGLETSQVAGITTIVDDSRTDGPPRVDVSTRELVASGPSKTNPIRGVEEPEPVALLSPGGTVEDALARAIEGAVAAGRWDVVAQLARELEARWLALAGVTSLADERIRREGPRSH